MLCNLINIVERKNYMCDIFYMSGILKILFTGCNMRSCRSRWGCIWRSQISRCSRTPVYQRYTNKQYSRSNARSAISVMFIRSECGTYFRGVHCRTSAMDDHRVHGTRWSGSLSSVQCTTYGNAQAKLQFKNP